MYKFSRIYIPMDFTTETIAEAMGKGRSYKSDVVGQDSFASPTGCRFRNVASVCEVLWQATATLTSLLVLCRSSMRRPLRSNEPRLRRPTLHFTVPVLNFEGSWERAKYAKQNQPLASRQPQGTCFTWSTRVNDTIGMHFCNVSRSCEKTDTS